VGADPGEPAGVVSGIRFRPPTALLFLGAGSIALAIEGFRLLRVIGRPSPAVREAPTSVSRTPPRWSRWAHIASSPSALRILAGASVVRLVERPVQDRQHPADTRRTGFFFAPLLTEEKENLASFGADYAAYMQRTRRFVPFLF